MSPSQDVAVAVALKRKSDREQEVVISSSRKRKPKQRKQNQRKSVSNNRKKKKRPWWMDLAYGGAIYALCLVIPAVYHRSIDFYDANLSLTIRRIFRSVAGVDAEWTDFGVVAILSGSLACLRIALVQWLVGTKSPEKVRAMARCKSLHLLSSAYPKSLTPQASKRKLQLPDLDTIPPPPLLGPASEYDNHDLLMPRLSMPDEDMLLMKPRPAMGEEEESWLESTWRTVRHSSQTALGVVDDDVKDSGLHTAPRFATAVFRTLYCIVSVYCALSWFGQSDFWPRAVGGTSGSTANCWNLKGSPGMEEDFDHMNSLLKGYYLMQASYHLHSGAFHMLTMGILWARKYTWDNSTKPFTAYWRSLLQHGIALLLIGGSHLFASTRRLGAIGSFALDVSSLLLHLLQICINAPFHVPPSLIKWFHRLLVIPLFLYCRLYLWPFVVWKSVLWESHGWLQQMEFTLFPGLEQTILWTFHGLILLLLGLNLVLLKRLLYHPHLQRVFHSKMN